MKTASKAKYPSRAKVMYVGIPADLKKSLAELAQTMDRSAAWCAKEAVREYLAKRQAQAN